MAHYQFMAKFSFECEKKNYLLFRKKINKGDL